MKHVPFHASAEVASALANAEAWRSDSRTIEPIHLFLALLRIIDGVFEQEAERMGLDSETIDEAATMAESGRALLSLPDDEIARLRRNLRKSRSDTGRRLPRRLRWSVAAINVFEHAATFALESEAIPAVKLPHLVRAFLLDPPADVVRFLPGETGQAPFRKPQSTEKAKPADLVIPPRFPPGDGAVPREPTTRRLSETFPEAELGLLARDLSALARAGRLAPVVGRRAEMKTLARYLQRTSKPNILVIGEAGVGKTAVVEGLAQRLAEDAAPEFLRNMRIVQIQVADLVAGTKYRGDLEQRLRDFLARVTADPDLVLFLDEIHLVMRRERAADS